MKSSGFVQDTANSFQDGCVVANRLKFIEYMWLPITGTAGIPFLASAPDLMSSPRNVRSPARILKKSGLRTRTALSNSRKHFTVRPSDQTSHLSKVCLNVPSSTRLRLTSSRVGGPSPPSSQTYSIRKAFALMSICLESFAIVVFGHPNLRFFPVVVVVAAAVLVPCWMLSLSSSLSSSSLESFPTLSLFPGGRGS